MSEMRHRSTFHETHPRFMLNNGIVEHDFRVNGGSREVVYTAGTEEQEHLRRDLTNNGIVLGYPVETSEGHVAYRVPAVSRPLALEAANPPVATEGPFTYSDKDLMYDLGELTARIHDLTGGVIGGPDAERAFSLVDFVAVGDSHLYATPGVERVLAAVPTGTDLLEAQMEAFSDTFGDRYGNHVDDFVRGYSQIDEQRQ